MRIFRSRSMNFYKHKNTQKPNHCKFNFWLHGLNFFLSFFVNKSSPIRSSSVVTYVCVLRLIQWQLLLILTEYRAYVSLSWKFSELFPQRILFFRKEKKKKDSMSRSASDLFPFSIIMRFRFRPGVFFAMAYRWLQVEIALSCGIHIK